MAFVRGLVTVPVCFVQCRNIARRARNCAVCLVAILPHVFFRRDTFARSFLPIAFARSCFTKNSREAIRL